MDSRRRQTNLKPEILIDQNAVPDPSGVQGGLQEHFHIKTREQKERQREKEENLNKNLR